MVEEEEEKHNVGESFPTGEFVFIFIFFYIISLIISFAYLWYYIDKKIVSKKLFVLCFVYFSFFIYLQFLVNIDLLCHEKDDLAFKEMQLILLCIKNYYKYLRYFTYSIKAFIFCYIGYKKSGFITKKNKYIDILLSHKKLIIAISTGAILGLLLGIILWIKKKVFIITYYGGLIDFFFNLLNYLGIIQIYLNVGFYFVNTCIDCKRQRSEKLIKRYNNFLITKITEKEKKSLKKLENAYNILNEEETQKFLKKVVAQSKQYIICGKKYGEIDENFYDDIKLKLDYVKNRNEIYKINEEKNENKNIKVTTINEDINEIGNYNVEKDNIQSSISPEKKINMTEKDLAPYIRTLKKSMRKIIRYNYLRKDIEKNINRDLNKTCCRKILLFFLFLFYFIISLAIIWDDFLFPIGLFYSEKKTSESTEYKSSSKEDSLAEFLGFVLFLLVITIINSPYTIAVLYSISKREFISRENFYGKNMGDNINLIETISDLTGFLYPLSFCNIYFYYMVFKFDENYTTPTLYEVVVIPDYLIKGKFNILIIIKFILILVFSILSHCFEIKNDMGRYNKYICTEFCEYDYIRVEDMPLAPIIS